MTSEQFAYWLQGFAELTDGPPSAEQWQSVRDHLAQVFHKVTPIRSAPNGFPPGYPMTTGVVAVDTTARLIC